jgi:TPR repeat protein
MLCAADEFDRVRETIMRNVFLVVAAFAIGMVVPATAQAPGDGARFYMQGDYARALAAWRPLAARGDAEAQNNLGLLYLDGKGVPANLAEAVRYFQLSAAAGSALGQNNLGGLYRDGRGVARDFAKAARWFAASASQGNSAGMYNLGLLYELGQGVKQDPVEASMWYALAAEVNDIPNAAAHRDALWRTMPGASQAHARQLVITCRQSGFKNCR